MQFCREAVLVHFDRRIFLLAADEAARLVPMADRPQFSVSSLLLLTALIAFLLGSYQWQPTFLSIAVRGVLMLFVGSLAIVGCCSTTGIARAFWIGVSIPLAFSLVSIGSISSVIVNLGMNDGQFDNANLGMAWANFKADIPLLCVTPLNGLLCALAYRLLWKRSTDVDSAGRGSIG
jgi:hypothetical protein